MSLFIYFLSLIAAFLLSPSPHAPNYQRQLIWNNAAQKYLLSLSLAKNRYLFTRPQIFVSKSTNICRALPQNVPQSAVLIDRLLLGFAWNPQIVRRQGCTALPQIYIFHIYTGPKFTQIPDLHGTQIYTNPNLHKPKFTQNLLLFKFCSNYTKWIPLSTLISSKKTMPL